MIMYIIDSLYDTILFTDSSGQTDPDLTVLKIST